MGQSEDNENIVLLDVLENVFLDQLDETSDLKELSNLIVGVNVVFIDQELVSIHER